MIEKPNENHGDKLTLKLNSIDQSSMMMGMHSNGHRTKQSETSTYGEYTRYNSIKFKDIDKDPRRSPT